MALSEEEVRWAYKVLLDREPESPAIITNNQGAHPNLAAIRRHLLASTEYISANPLSAGVGDLTVIAPLTAYRLPQGRLFVNLSDAIGLGVARGGYETEEIGFLQKHLKPGDTFLDVGGNVGLFSIVAGYAVGPAGKVIAVEAVPANADSLWASVLENRLETTIELHRLLVVDKPRSDVFIAYLPLSAGAGNSGGASIVSAAEAANIMPPAVCEPITQATLDDIVDGRKIDLIKIDIEGAEVLAFQGATRLLSDTDRRPATIMSEVHTSQLAKVSGATWQDYFTLMRGYGYEADCEGHEGVFNVVFSLTANGA